MRVIGVVGLSLFLLAGCGRPSGRTVLHSETRPDRDPTMLTEQGKMYFEVGDTLRAQQYFAASLKAGADERVVFPLLLRACVAQRNFRLAVDYAEAALAKHPRDARLRFLTGALHGELGETARARDRFERAAKELPTDAEAQFTVGVFFRDDASDVVSADRYFRQYLALAPDGAHAEEAKSSLMERVE